MITAKVIIPGKLYMRGVFHKYSKAYKLEFLESLGVDTVVNLWHTADQELLDTLGAHYHHRFFPDSNREIPQDWLLGFAAGLADRIREGHGVLIHCFGGRNRSGMLCALVYRELTGCTGAEALEHVRKQKPGAIETPLFEKFLRSLS